MRTPDGTGPTGGVQRVATAGQGRLEALVEEAQAAFLDPTLAVVGRWKARSGRPAVGCFPVYAPEEILHAAGILPVALFGGGDRIEIDRADSYMQSFMCSISRSTLELALKGHLDILDGMIFPSICDVDRNLSGVWERHFRAHLVHYLHLPQNITSRHAVGYLQAEYRALRRRLEEHFGLAMQDGALATSIALYNRHRDLLRRLYALRAAHPERVPLHEAYALVRVGGLMPKEDHLPLLEEALELFQARTRRPRDRVRVMVEGAFCEQPPFELLRVIEEAGCYVVGDDFLLGGRWITRPVEPRGDPLEALARAYVEASHPSPVRWDGPTTRIQEFVARARALQVDGVVFLWPKFCDVAQFDYVLLKQALEEEGIRYLPLEFEEKMSVFEGIRSEVETFVESILFFSTPEPV